MGFNEVILNDFYMPDSSSIVYDFGGKSAADISEDAYFALLENTVDLCKIGLLVTDPYEGHPLFDAADRVYVCYEEGSTVRRYAESHEDQYLVFITGSHDTRFDDYGKIEADSDFTFDAVPDGTETLPDEAEPEEEPEDPDAEETEEDTDE